MSKYKVTTEDGKSYMVTTEDAHSPVVSGSSLDLPGSTPRLRAAVGAPAPTEVPGLTSGEYSGPTGTVAPGEGLLHAGARQVIGGVKDAVTGMASSFVPKNPAELAAYALGGPIGLLSSQVSKSHYESGKKTVELAKHRNQTETNAEAVSQGIATLVPGVGPMLKDMFNRAETGTVGPIGEVAAMAAAPEVLGKIGGKLGEVVAARKAASTAAAHSTAIKEFATTMGADSTAPFLNRAKDAVITDVGGKQNIKNASDWHEATKISADARAKDVRAIIGQNPQAPVSIEAIRPEVDAFLTGGFSRNNPALASALEEGLKTGSIPAEQAYNLKIEMNKFYKPNIGDVTAYKPRDAHAVASHLRSSLNDIFGNDFTQADILQGNIQELRGMAEDTAGRASMESNRTPPVTPGEVIHAGHRPVSGAVMATLRRMPGFRNLTTDAAVAKAIQDMQFQDVPRVNVQPDSFLQTNLQGGGRGFKGPGPEVPSSITPDPRLEYPGTPIERPAPGGKRNPLRNENPLADPAYGPNAPKVPSTSQFDTSVMDTLMERARRDAGEAVTRGRLDRQGPPVRENRVLTNRSGMGNAAEPIPEAGIPRPIGQRFAPEQGMGMPTSRNAPTMQRPRATPASRNAEIPYNRATQILWKKALEYRFPDAAPSEIKAAVDHATDLGMFGGKK